MTTPNPRTNPNSSEYDPSFRSPERDTSLSVEEMNGYNATLYGFVDRGSDAAKTVESLGAEGIGMDTINRARGDVPTADIGSVEIDADDAAYNATKIENGANQLLGDVGLGSAANGSIVTHEAAMGAAVAEQLEYGTESDDTEIRRAKHAQLAIELGKAVARGDLAPFESIADAHGANDVGYRLHELQQRYGLVQYAPLDELAVVGALIDYAKKSAPENDGKIVESKDGQVEVEDIDELSSQAREGDAEAIKQLVESDKTDEIIDATEEAKLIAAYGSLEQVPTEVWQEMTTKKGLGKDNFTLKA